MSPIIDADALVEEVIRELPEVAVALRRRGVICVKCGEPVWGTLREILCAAGLDAQQVIDELRTELAAADASR